MKGVSFFDMTEKESEVATTGIIFKISVICGCQLPTNEAHINVLETEFLIFLKEFGYDVLTMEEILTAFRMNAAFKLDEKIEHFQALFNIDYAGKILRLYWKHRAALDTKLADHDQVETTKKKLNDESDARRKKIIEQYAKYLRDEEINLVDCYMQLVEDNAFADKKFCDRFGTSGEIDTNPHRIARTVSVKDFMENWDRDLAEAFKAGYAATRFYFKQLKLSGKTAIYNESLQLLYPNLEVPETFVIHQEEFQ